MSDFADIEPPGRLYTIQNSTYYFYTGHLSNGHQVMTLSDCGPGGEPGLAGLPRVEFNADGNVVAAYTEDHLPPPSEPIYFTPGTIHVKFFLIEEMWFAVYELPMYLQDFFEDQETADEEDNRDSSESIAAWRERGDFCVLCNEEYWLNKEGWVHSS